MPDFSTFFTTSKFRKIFVATGFSAFFAVSAFKKNRDITADALAKLLEANQTHVES
jgi:hypothetical protein